MSWAPAVTTAGAPDVGDSYLASNKSVQTVGLAAAPKLEVEGINITDSGSTASASYTSAFPYGEMLVKTSGNDPEVSTAGILMVAQLKSGGNDFHGTGQFAFETPGLQSNNITPQLQSQGLSSVRWRQEGSRGRARGGCHRGPIRAVVAMRTCETSAVASLWIQRDAIARQPSRKNEVSEEWWAAIGLEPMTSCVKQCQRKTGMDSCGIAE